MFMPSSCLEQSLSEKMTNDMVKSRNLSTDDTASKMMFLPQASMVGTEAKQVGVNDPAQFVNTKQPKKKGHKKLPWSRNEDEQLLELISQYGANNWENLAKKLYNRSGKQCRERYYNILDPSVKRGPWTDEEDFLIMHHYNKVGSRWAEISKYLGGRTDNAIKNRWHSLRVAGTKEVIEQSPPHKKQKLSLTTHDISNSVALLLSESVSSPI